jgi:steroid 5-alpha reductase family enzyme
VDTNDHGNIHNELSCSFENMIYSFYLLVAVAALVVLPATLYRPLYMLTIGYGGSVATMGLVLYYFQHHTTVSRALAAVTFFYGIRLAAYLFIRDLSGWKPQSPEPSLGRVTAIPMALGLSVFYALMVSPVLHVWRVPPVVPAIAWIGLGMAWAGALLEAVADQHKHLIKQQNPDTGNKFVGPSTGVYRLCRHPNYFGEILFWTGLWTSALSSYNSRLPLLYTSAGWMGIVSIMWMMNKRMENRHKLKYGGQPAYEKWRGEVIGSLVPFLSF